MKLSQLKTETREEIFDPVSESFFSIRLLLSIHYFIWPNLIIRLQFDVLPTGIGLLLYCRCWHDNSWQCDSWTGGIVGSLMEPLYCVTAWDYYKGKTQQQHIKQFNIHTQHLPTVRRAFCRPQCGVQNGSQQQQSLHWDMVGGEKSLRGVCQPIGLQLWLFGGARLAVHFGGGRSFIGGIVTEGRREIID